MNTECQEWTQVSVNLNAVSVPFVNEFGPSPQKKGGGPTQLKLNPIKSVKPVFCIVPCLSVPPVDNVLPVTPPHPVGARLQGFWRKWELLGASPKVILLLKEGYVLPIISRPNLSRYPLIQSCYQSHMKNQALLAAVQQLLEKQAIELVTKQKSLGFYNRLFLVPKPNNRWRPILDLSILNTFLTVEKFKMETPESIRVSLQQGEWVTSIDFRDAYFHIPINQLSRKFMRFHVQGKTYQFKALPFGLATAPMEFTVVAREVKLMAQMQGLRIHQHLDDWLVRPGVPTPE